MRLKRDLRATSNGNLLFKDSLRHFCSPTLGIDLCVWKRTVDERRSNK